MRLWALPCSFVGKATVPPWERCPLVVVIFWKIVLTSEGVNPYMLVMKLSELITERLLLVGVERPAARLVEEIEKLIVGRVRSAVFGMVTPRLTKVRMKCIPRYIGFPASIYVPGCVATIATSSINPWFSRGCLRPCCRPSNAWQLGGPAV